MYRPRSIPNSSPREAKGVYGHMLSEPVTPLGFKRLLDTVFYIPVAPLGLKSCGYHFFYTPIAPLGLKSCGCFRCYKHIVPTGLKRVSRTRKTTKLPPMVRFGNRTYRPKLTPMVRFGNRTYRTWRITKLTPMCEHSIHPTNQQCKFFRYVS